MTPASPHYPAPHRPPRWRRDLPVAAFGLCCAAIGAIAVTAPYGLSAAIMLALALWAGWQILKSPGVSRTATPAVSRLRRPTPGTPALSGAGRAAHERGERL